MTAEEKIARIAPVVHGANNMWNMVLGDCAPNAPWDALGEEGQYFVFLRVRQILEGDSPEDLQGAWDTYVTARGWRQGAVKDPAEKTHPNVGRELEDLPEDQQRKVYLAIAITFALSMPLAELDALLRLGSLVQSAGA